MTEPTELSIRIQVAIDGRRKLAEIAEQSWPSPWKVTGGGVEYDSDENYRMVCNSDGFDADYHIAANDPQKILADCRLAEELLDLKVHEVEVALAKAWGIESE